MVKTIMCAALVLLTGSSFAQASSTKYSIAAEVVGGKEETEQVIETQLTLPKTLLTSHFQAEVKAYFDLDQ